MNIKKGKLGPEVLERILMDTVNGYSLFLFLSTTKDFYGTLLWHFLALALSCAA